MTLTETITQRAADAGGKLRVRSALNPVLWMCGIITIPCVFVITQSNSQPPTWLVIITVAPVAVAVLGFLFLLFFDRDKLQSEDFQIRKKSLEIIQEKGDSFAIATTSIDAISNPQRSLLGLNGKGGNK